jgi:hypothetical protein
MIEYIVVFIIVVLAVWFVGKRLWRDSSGFACDGCNCCARRGETDGISRTQPSNKKML